MEKIMEIKMKDGSVKYFEQTENGYNEVDKPASRWMPKINDFYYFIDSLHVIREGLFDDDWADRKRILYSNCFKTKEEAERKHEIMNLIHNHIGEGVGKDKDVRYDVIYSAERDCLDIDCNTVIYSTPYYFPSQNIAQMIIDEIGKDDWKKYVLGIYD